MPINDIITQQDCFEYLRTEIFSSKSIWKKELHHRSAAEEIGLEIEMFPVRNSHHQETPQLVRLFDGEGSLLSLLNTIYNDKNSTRKYAPVAHPNHGSREVLYEIAVEKEGRITFEPGGQIEFSSRPFSQLSELISHLKKIQRELDAGFQSRNVFLIQAGMNPWFGVNEIGLQMNQGRYQGMTDYFSPLNGGVGIQMMRQSCSIQVNLDYGRDHQVMIQRFLAAHLLAPFTTAIFSNSPIVKKKRTEYHNYRGWIWQHIDPTRSGLNFPLMKKMQQAPTQETCIRGYLEFALKAPVVFIEDLDFLVPPKNLTFENWVKSPFEFQGRKISPTLHDFIVHLSLLFPEVRPRGFIEIRSIDCLGREMQFLPALFYLGLLYDSTALQSVLEFLLPKIDDLPQMLQEALYGLKNPELSEIARRLFSMAEEGLSRLPAKYRDKIEEGKFQNFRSHYVEKGRTPADDLIDQWGKEGPKDFGVKGMRKVEELQKEKFL